MLKSEYKNKRKMSPSEAGRLGGFKSGGHNKSSFKKKDLLIVEESASHGANQRQIADYLGVHESTLRRLLKSDRKLTEHVKKGKDRANQAIQGKMFEVAMKGNVSMLIFWAKARFGWRETSVMEHIGGEIPIKTEIKTVVDLSKLSVVELKKLRDLKEQEVEIKSKAHTHVEVEAEEEHGGLEIPL